MSKVKYVNNHAALKIWVTSDCPECDGEGNHQIGPQCFKPSSDCCGGCYNLESCDACSGTGKVNTTLDPETIGQIIDHLICRDYHEARTLVTLNCDINDIET
jgi:hypothetical protein